MSSNDDTEQTLANLSPLNQGQIHYLLDKVETDAENLAHSIELLMLQTTASMAEVNMLTSTTAELQCNIIQNTEELVNERITEAEAIIKQCLSLNTHVQELAPTLHHKLLRTTALLARLETALKATLCPDPPKT